MSGGVDPRMEMTEAELDYRLGFGELLRRIRDERELSREQLAATVGRGRGTREHPTAEAIARWERGTYLPSAYVVGCLCYSLHVEPTLLVAPVGSRDLNARMEAIRKHRPAQTGTFFGDETDFRRRLGVRLTLLRERRRRSRADLGALIGRSEMTIGRWERGTYAPSAYDISRLCGVLRVSADDLINLPGEQESNRWLGGRRPHLPEPKGDGRANC
jgi:transcriptional regulator with XRE-family HTH domain